jgi:hypothetical protein
LAAKPMRAATVKEAVVEIPTAEIVAKSLLRADPPGVQFH